MYQANTSESYATTTRKVYASHHQMRNDCTNLRRVDGRVQTVSAQHTAIEETTRLMAVTLVCESHKPPRNSSDAFGPRPTLASFYSGLEGLGIYHPKVSHHDDSLPTTAKMMALGKASSIPVEGLLSAAMGRGDRHSQSIWQISLVCTP